MRRSVLALGASIVMVAGACTGGATPAPSSGGGSSAAPIESSGASGGASGAASAGASAGAGGSAAASLDTSITGTAKLSGWQSSDAENKALQDTIKAFEAVDPNIKVDYSVVAGDYATVMATNFSSKNVPDLFYVDAGYGQTWADQGFLQPLDDYISKSGFDTSTFFPGYLAPFKGSDGKTYGLPKDGNTIGLAYNTADVPTAPKTLDELMTTAQGLKGKSGLKAPMCLSPGLDRGLAFIYAQGGSLLSDDGKTDMVDSQQTKSAIQWYLDLFKNGVGMTPSDMGDDWCGTSLGKGHAAMIFEGGWLDPAMSSTYPSIKYSWAPMPTGSSGSPVTISYTAAYSIGADSANKDQAWVLMQYLVGVQGMTKWTEGGVALPSRSDVPTPKGKDVLVSQAQYAKPGSGFMKNYNDVQKAFQDAFTAEIQNKTYSADAVVAATKAAIDKALGS
ncbi:MAG TPA: sugar ABC transporter substrate-binding protein [Candidatus Limnocylindrales bacterium]|nr:sugar ABC transporter substrate-binding protein [Candidatus Limnocylindrales bacterium]